MAKRHGALRAGQVFLLFLFFGAGSILAAWSACGRGTGRKPSDLEEGRAALAAGRPSEALPLLERAVKQDPEGIGPRRLLAKALVALGKLSKARDILERGLRVSKKGEPERYPLLLDLADVLIRQGRYGEAAEAYGRAIREKPDQVAAYWRLGELYEMNHQWKDARAAYEKLLAKSPGGAVAAEVRLRMARCALKAGDAVLARKDAEKGLSVPGAAPKVRLGLERLAGSAALAQKDWQTAVRHLRFVTHEAPRDARGWALLARALISSEGCSPRALGALRRAAGLEVGLAGRGLACLARSSKKGDAALALKAGLLADKEQHLDQSGKLLLAQLFLKTNRPDRALDIVDSLAASQGRLGGEAGLVRARALASLGRHQEAFAEFSRLVAQGLRKPEVLRGQALEAVWSGHYRVGARLLGPLVAKAKSNPELLTALAVALGGMGRAAKARGLLRQAAQAATETRDTLALERTMVYSAWLDLRGGRYQSALNKARPLTNRPGPFQLHAFDIQAQALLRLGKKKDATAVIQRALARNPGPVQAKYFRSLLGQAAAQSSPRRKE